MEHLILLIGLFLNGPQTDVRILQQFTNPKACHQAAEKRAARADQRYRFFCRPVKGTVI